jgi:hypothetical protein
MVRSQMIAAKGPSSSRATSARFAFGLDVVTPLQDPLEAPQESLVIVDDQQFGLFANHLLDAIDVE